MKLLVFFTASLLAGLAYSAPASETVPATTSDTLTITAEFFPDELAVYTSQYDVVKILTPLNALNFGDDADEEEESDSDTVTFIVEAEFRNGEAFSKGLSLLKNGQVTKLLDNGRDAAAANDDTKTAYFATNEGIYFYNAAKNTAEKYGTLTDDLISIAKVNGSDVIYVLTADNVLYRVTEEGTKKEVVEKVVGAQEIILDYENNLYYTTSNNEIYVLVGDDVKKIQGLPANPTSVTIINPPFVIENGVPAIIDNRSYIVYENGTSEFGEIDFVVKPTAYSMEATLIQYYAYNKKVYEYNILALLLGELLEELKTFLDDKTDSIQSIATRSRSDLRA